MGFLSGLNDNFEYVRTQILILDLLPSMSRVMYLITQYDKQTFEVPKIVKNAKKSLILAVKFWNKIFSFKKPFCTHCYKEYHTIDKCSRLYGFSPGSKPKPRFNQVLIATTTEVVVESKGQFGFSAE